MIRILFSIVSVIIVSVFSTDLSAQGRNKPTASLSENDILFSLSGVYLGMSKEEFGEINFPERHMSLQSSLTGPEWALYSNTYTFPGDNININRIRFSQDDKIVSFDYSRGWDILRSNYRDIKTWKKVLIEALSSRWGKPSSNGCEEDKLNVNCNISWYYDGKDKWISVHLSANCCGNKQYASMKVSYSNQKYFEEVNRITAEEERGKLIEDSRRMGVELFK